jgi:predicted regulator of Ras-like GTPase activity (Roadblock/LC7/MglB family)
LIDNPHVEQVLCASSDGRLLRASRNLAGNSEHAAVMLQSADVLAQALASALGCGAATLVQITTQREHIIVVPLLDSAYYVAVQVARTAPLLLFMIELERALAQVQADDFIEVSDSDARSDDTPVLDAAELIAAVREWLRGRSALR